MRNGVMSFDEFCFDEFYKNTYECDPDKNTECTKEGCYINGGECSRTTEKKYAREDKKILKYEDYEVKKVFDEDLKSEIKILIKSYFQGDRLCVIGACDWDLSEDLNGLIIALLKHLTEGK